MGVSRGFRKLSNRFPLVPSLTNVSTSTAFDQLLSSPFRVTEGRPWINNLASSHSPAQETNRLTQRYYNATDGLPTTVLVFVRVRYGRVPNKVPSLFGFKLQAPGSLASKLLSLSVISNRNPSAARRATQQVSADFVPTYSRRLVWSSMSKKLTALGGLVALVIKIFYRQRHPRSASQYR